MQSLAKGNETEKKQYLKPRSYEETMNRIGTLFLFTYFVLPQYFGLDLPFFDFTAQRIMIVLLLVYLLEKASRTKQFLKDIKHCSLLPLMSLYLFILLYTAIYNKHLGTILYSFIEFLAFFLVLYLIKDGIGINRTIKLLILFSYILCLLGLVEYVMGRTPFAFMETIPGLFTHGQVRSGSYRIMGPCNHSLGYGLALITMLPLACYDAEKEEIDMLIHWPLFALIAINVLLTGSRSTLSVWGVEVILFFLFSAKEKKRRFIVIMIFAFIGVAAVTVLTIKTSFGRYIMLQFTTIIDELFGTSLAVSFGADARKLGNSATYRDLLLDIFGVSWLNPWLGKGAGYSFYWYHNGFRIESIDNFYVANYIRYGYPGMIAYLLIIVYTLGRMLRDAIKKKSALIKCMFIGSLCYFINLWWLDTLQTIKYVYILFAFYYAFEQMNKKEKIEKTTSKYIK